MNSIKELTLHEDENLLILNKPNGLALQTANTESVSVESMLKETLETYHIISRVDQVVSGIILIGKNRPTASLFSKKLKKQQVHKTYYAIVEGHPEKESATLNNKIFKKGSKAYVNKSEGKQAILHYNTYKKLDNYTILTVKIETGRFHQIRCQLAHIGHPIKGDLKYGSRRSNKEGGIYLHCQSLKIEDYPNEEENFTINAPYPPMKLWELV